MPPEIKPHLLPRFICSLTSHGHDCDCCGWYTDEECVLEGPAETFNFYSDGHLGGGTWNGQVSEVYKIIAIQLGIELRLPDYGSGNTEPSKVALNELVVFDSTLLDSYGNPEPLNPAVLTGPSHGLKKISACYGQLPTDEHEGELLFFLNDSLEPYAAFCAEGLVSKAPQDLRAIPWQGDPFEALGAVLVELGILVELSDHSN